MTVSEEKQEKKTLLHLHCLPSITPSPAAAVPIFTVDDLQVHVDPRDEHLAVDADLVDGGRREGVSHHHHPHDLIGHRAAVRQGHPDTQASGDVDHLQRAQKRQVSSRHDVTVRGSEQRHSG